MRERVAGELGEHEPVSIGLTGERRERALSLNRALVGAPMLPAHVRYSGVVLEHADVPTLTSAARERAEAQVLFVSALGGLFEWGEGVPEYRLKMGARLGSLGRMSRAWRPHIAQVLQGSGPVVSLLPLEHADAVASADQDGWLHVDLVGPDGQRSGHAGKAAKGRLLRRLLESPDPAGLLAGGFAGELGGFTVSVRIS
jgi:cytoplasmic iron level regulating protein YaaA (DUF328/UPF0246 family)